MLMSGAVLTAIIVMAIVFAALCALYISIRVFSAIVRKIENITSAGQSAQK